MLSKLKYKILRIIALTMNLSVINTMAQPIVTPGAFLSRTDFGIYDLSRVEILSDGLNPLNSFLIIEEVVGRMGQAAFSANGVPRTVAADGTRLLKLRVIPTGGYSGLPDEYSQGDRVEDDKEVFVIPNEPKEGKEYPKSLRLGAFPQLFPKDFEILPSLSMSVIGPNKVQFQKSTGPASVVNALTPLVRLTNLETPLHLADVSGAPIPYVVPGIVSTEILGFSGNGSELAEPRIAVVRTEAGGRGGPLSISYHPVTSEMHSFNVSSGASSVRTGRDFGNIAIQRTNAPDVRVTVTPPLVATEPVEPKILPKLIRWNDRGEARAVKPIVTYKPQTPALITAAAPKTTQIYLYDGEEMANGRFSRELFGERNIDNPDDFREWLSKRAFEIAMIEDSSGNQHLRLHLFEKSHTVDAESKGGDADSVAFMWLNSKTPGSPMTFKIGKTDLIDNDVRDENLVLIVYPDGRIGLKNKVGGSEKIVKPLEQLNHFEGIPIQYQWSDDEVEVISKGSSSADVKVYGRGTKPVTARLVFLNNEGGLIKIYNTAEITAAGESVVTSNPLNSSNPAGIDFGVLNLKDSTGVRFDVATASQRTATSDTLGHTAEDAVLALVAKMKGLEIWTEQAPDNSKPLPAEILQIPSLKAQQLHFRGKLGDEVVSIQTRDLPMKDQVLASFIVKLPKDQSELRFDSRPANPDLIADRDWFAQMSVRLSETPEGFKIARGPQLNRIVLSWPPHRGVLKPTLVIGHTWSTDDDSDYHPPLIASEIKFEPGSATQGVRPVVSNDLFRAAHNLCRIKMQALALKTH